MKAFMLLLYIGLIGTSYGLPTPQPWLSNLFGSGVQAGADVTTTGLKIGNNAVQLAAGLKIGSTQAGTDVAKMALAAGTSLGSGGLKGATDLAGHGLDAAKTLSSSIPIFGSTVNVLTGLGKTGLNAANAVGQTGLSVANGAGQQSLSAMNTVTQLKTNTLANLANIGFNLGQQGIQAGAKAITGLTGTLMQGNQPLKITDNMQQNVDSLITGLQGQAGEIAAKVGSLIKGDGPKLVSEMTQTVGNLVNEVGSLAGDSQLIYQNIQMTRQQLENIGNEIKLVLAKLAGKPIGEQLQGLSDGVSIMLGHVGSAVAGERGAAVMADIGKHLGNALNEIGSIVSGNSVQKIVSTIGSVGNSVGNAVLEVRSAISNGIGKSVDEFVGNVGDKVESALGQVGSAVGGSGKQILGGIGEKVGNVMKQVGSAVGVGSKAVDKLGSLANGLGGEMGQVIGQVQGFVATTNGNDIFHLVTDNLVPSKPVADLLNQYGSVIGGVVGANISNNPAEKVPAEVGKNVQNAISNVGSYLSLFTG